MASPNEKIQLLENGRLDLRALLAGETAVLEFEYKFIKFIPDAAMADIVPLGDAHMEGKLTNTAGYLRLEADLSLRYRTVCARCASELERELHIPIEKDLAVRGQLQDEDKDDYLIVDNGALDLEPLAVEELYLGMPMRELCSENCRGLCYKCGKNLNEGPCSCPEREPDPRLAVLSKWSDKNK
jgi:Predicted metal-binding, possibly nucleic acid-binding protein